MNFEERCSTILQEWMSYSFMFLRIMRKYQGRGRSETT